MQNQAIENNWRFNVMAVSAAKSCILGLKSEFGIRVKLTDPHFLSLVGEYIELSESEDLKLKFATLCQLTNFQTKSTKLNTFSRPNADELVEYRGKKYSRFNDEGKEFKGLYRGQANYR